jgi:hypothetical protein
MLDVLTKVIPWIQAYPTWPQTIVAAWIVFTAVILAALLLTPRSLQQHGSETLNPTAATTGSKTPAASDDFKTPAGQPSIQQQTKGDNSPAVAGVEGDVNIKVEQRKNAK